MFLCSVVAAIITASLISPLCFVGFAAPVTDGSDKFAYPTVPCSPRRGASAGVTFAMPGSCNSYYECTFMGNVIIKNCPPGRQYNSISDTCDLASNVNCDQVRDGVTVVKLDFKKESPVNVDEPDREQEEKDSEHIRTLKTRAIYAPIQRDLYHLGDGLQQPYQDQLQQEKDKKFDVKKDYIRFASKRNGLVDAGFEIVNPVVAAVGGNTGVSPVAAAEDVVGDTGDAASGAIGSVADGLGL